VRPPMPESKRPMGLSLFIFDFRLPILDYKSR
jgi:hypothetical protein